MNVRDYLDIEAAVRQVIAAAIEGTIPVDAAVKLAVATVVSDPGETDDTGATWTSSSIERPAARRARVNAEMLTELLALEQRVGARATVGIPALEVVVAFIIAVPLGAAVGILARQLADPSDPAAVEAVAKHLRRLRLRHRKKSTHCAVGRLPSL